MKGKEIKGKEIKGKEIRGKEIREKEIRGKEIRGKEIKGKEIKGKGIKGKEIKVLFCVWGMEEKRPSIAVFLLIVAGLWACLPLGSTSVEDDDQELLNERAQIKPGDGSVIPLFFDSFAETTKTDLWFILL